VRLPQEALHNTESRTHDGHFELKALCFDVTNAPATARKVKHDMFKHC